MDLAAQQSFRRVALITGASRGIGAAIALRLARAGYSIWANYRSNHAAAENLQQQITSFDGDCTLLPFDVSDAEAVNRILVPKLNEAVPQVLVNNAGINHDSLLMWMERETWQSVLDVNLSGFFHVTKSVLLEMLKRKSGRIINIASTAGQAGRAGQVNYSAAKAGVIGATKALALEVCKKGVIVNCVAPGLIETDMIARLPKNEILAAIPVGRFGTADEVAATVEFLCSDEAGYIIGQVIAVNGGLYV
jgi:3-oxoacyl-[acyl-carrier protein] reductase